MNLSRFVSHRVPSRIALSLATVLAVVWITRAADAPIDPTPTHEQSKSIVVRGESNKALQLQTLCLDGTGRIVALVAPPRNVSYGSSQGENKAVSEIRIFDDDGKPVKSWQVNFVAQSVAAGPQGSILVAGDGRLGKFDKDGKLLVESDVPHLATILRDTAKLRKNAEDQLKAEVQSFEEMTKQFQEQKEQLTKKGMDKLTASEKAQLQGLEMNIKSYEQIAAQYKKRSVNDVVRDLTARLRVINGIAATDKDVYVACGEMQGYGYAVWRFDHDFKNAKQIISGLGGCCGQMDIQASGDEVLVAENTKHAVGRYTRDGKKLGLFGKQGREGDPECFGGCCNPMNCCVGPQGAIYTAESEGYIKMFSAKGEFIGPVGTASLKGGCKNVAVAVSPDGSKVYFCDQPGSQIIVLARKSGPSGNK